MLQQLTPRVYQLPFSKELDRPVLGYVRGERFSLMIDGGNSPAHVQAYEAAVQAAGLPLPQLAVLTHCHWDHCFGMSALSIPAIACAQTQQSLKIVSALKWTPEEMEKNIQRGILPAPCAPRIQLHFPEPSQIRVMLPTIVFSHRLTLDLGGCTCQLMHVPSPHSRDTVIVYIPEERMVFLGDAVYQELKGDVWTEHPEQLEGLIRVLEPLDFVFGQPAHQKAMTKEALLSWFWRRIRQTKESGA